MKQTTFKIKQSGGYLYAQLAGVQALFIVAYVLIVLLGDEASTLVDSVPVFRVSETDILLVLVGSLVQTLLSLFVFARWQTTEYRITEHQLEIMSGFMGRNLRSIELSGVSSCSARSGPVGAFANFGSVIIKQRQENDSVTLTGIPYPNQFVKRVQDSIAASNRTP